MAGMLFVVCVPTAEKEYEMVHGLPPPPGRGPLVNLDGPGVTRAEPVQTRGRKQVPDNVPMERVLEGLLKKLEIEHVVWCADKNTSYYQVFFPVGSGDPTENCLHSLTELKIGKKHNSVVSVVPCNVFMQGFDSAEDEEEVDPSDKKAWDSFVDSVRAKLTVKQVVDGVRGGATVTFDYVTLILTADMVAVIGLLESSAVNIVAAMLISPLMGPVMALTFGTAIADRSLQWTGVKGLLTGGAISLVFGFIFGLLVGTTEMPWGTGGSFPTEEMLGRGNYRSLWIGVLWALPSGTGVALALMQGMAGPLIGVAISASLLPPIVNCGLFWGLLCTKIGYGDRMVFPYVGGEPQNVTTPTFQHTYSDHLPTELTINGIISFCLTLVNVGCIFITAIIVLKIKEVAAPYTSGPDLRRFWEHDIPIARDTNRMSMRKSKEARATATPAGRTQVYSSVPMEDMETLEVAMREAMDDDVFRKVKRASYAHTASDLSATLGIHAGIPPGSRPGSVYGGLGGLGGAGGAGGAALGSSGLDPALLDQLITSLLGVQAANSRSGTAPSAAERVQVTAGLSRFRPLSRSLRPGSTRRVGSIRGGNRGGGGAGGGGVAGHAALPTIEEGATRSIRRPRPMSLTERALSTPAVRAVAQAVQAAPQRFFGTQPGEGAGAEDPLLEQVPRPPRFNVRRGSASNTSLM
ncbi:hypothetical protein ONE63_006084 [Megalurothrips usitatus]|uniref:Uncharacterized protein n=1 Tax=Megalurothrips usitatus TaxID=439358 RepID=A0AAV7XVI6_9NEOP|nr:hypothetical protein ONE63_006084 [Megalurothrips usitatus]